MAQLTTLNGVSYSIPDPGDSGWGAGLTAFLVAIAPGVLQKTGGSFTLTSDIDFGAAFGLKSAYFSSRNANPATTGIFRLANTEALSFRNFANSGDLSLTTNASDLLTFNGSAIAVDSSVVHIAGTETITGAKSFTLGTTFLSGTASTVPYLDASKILVSSSVTPTELSYLSGVTSAIQTQLNLKAPLASPTFTGVVTIPTPFTLGATSVTATGTELNYSVGVTSSIQTQLNAKATDSLVVHLAGTETITGTKTFTSTSGTGFGSSSAPSASTLGGLDIWSGGLGIVIGADSAASTRTNATTKLGRITGAHYTNAEEPMGIAVSSVDSTSNLLSLGGGSGLVNAATEVRIFAAANQTTTTGTQVGSFKTTGVSIQGTTTNDSAAAGFIGEEIRSAVSTATNFPTTGTWGDLTSISLTAGDWSVNGHLRASLNGATMTGFQISITTTSGNSTTGMVSGDNEFGNLPPTSSTSSSATVAGYRFSLSATTTVYLKYLADFSAGTPQSRGRISARRLR